MNALDRFVKFCAAIADGFTGARRPPREPDHEPQQNARPAAGSGAARTTAGASDDRNRPPSSGSHPAVWPR